MDLAKKNEKTARNLFLKKNGHKVSKYNIIIPNNDNGDALVYNALSGAILKSDKNFAERLKQKDAFYLRAWDSTLSDLGIFVPTDTDELQIYKDMHKNWKSGKELAEFNMLITYDCNFACPYCYQGRDEESSKIHNYKSMTPEMIESFKKFVKRTIKDRNSKKMSLVLYGGEPSLMLNECVETTDDLANWASRNGVKFNLQMLTNGSHITPDFIKWASDYNMRIQIPVDGDSEQHNKMRFYKKTGKGSFDGITEVLHHMKGTNIEPHIRISLTDETYPTMEHMLDELKEKDLTHIYTDFCYITAFTDACEGYKNHCLSDTKLFKVMPELWREAHKRGFKLDIRPTPQPLSCSSVADGSFIVDPFGNIYKCWEQVGLEEHIVGKMNQDGTMEKTGVYQDVLDRDPTEIPECKDHIYLPSCAGGCVCKAYWQSKTYHASGCGTENHLLPDKIKLYAEMNDRDIYGYNYGLDGMKFEIIDGKAEPNMRHCYTLV